MRARLRGVPRAALAVLAAALALAIPIAAGASTAGASANDTATVSGAITLRAKFHQGAWKTSLYLKLVKLRLDSFSLCAIWDHKPGDPFDCDAAAANSQPEGTILRLEQNPIAKALKRADSPGWGMLGASQDGALGAVLSNLLTGNKRGTFHYRVTLRDRTGHVLVTSNPFTLIWH
jgi:hypothetical protein